MRLAPILAFAGLAAAGAIFVAFGRFNIDEGLHLNAGRLIYERGWLPYRDFPFSQGPGAPLLYGAAGALFGSSLLVGRCLSLGLDLLGVAALAAVAARFGGSSAALVTVGFTLVNFPALWTFSQVRTEPPAIALTALALFAWLRSEGPAWRQALAPSLLVWASAARLTHAVPLLALCALLLWQLRRSPRRALLVGAIVGSQALLAFWPLLASPEQGFFHVFTSQLGRSDRFGWPDFSAAKRVWFFARPDAGFQPILVASALPVWLLWRRLRAGWRPDLARIGDDPVLAVALLLASALLCYAPQLVLRVGFFSYFVNASLLLITAIGIATPLVARAGARASRLAWGGVLACAAVSAVLGITHVDTFIDPGAPTVRRFAPLRAQIEAMAPEGCTMLTFETHLAVETGCDVVRGLEYSYFSFFPELDPEEARAHGVLDRALLGELLRRDPPELVALTRNGFERMTGRKPESGERPRLPEMGLRYRLLEVLQVPIGPTHNFWNKVFLYRRRDLAPLPRTSSTPGSRARAGSAPARGRRRSRAVPRARGRASSAPPRAPA